MFIYFNSSLQIRDLKSTLVDTSIRGSHVNHIELRGHEGEEHAQGRGAATSPGLRRERRIGEGNGAATQERELGRKNKKKHVIMGRQGENPRKK